MRASILCLLVLSACGDFGTNIDGGADGSPGATMDAGALDASNDSDPTDDGGGLSDSSTDPSPEHEGIWLTADRGSEGDELSGFASRASGTCFDGRDNDEASSDAPDGIDCADPDCQPLPTCCVDDVDCVASYETVVDTHFDDCADAVCGGPFDPFGAPSIPVFDDRTLAMMGDREYDSGWLGQDSFDLASDRVEIVVDFKYGSCSDCFETTAVGLTRQTTLTDESHVQPVVAVVAIARPEPALQVLVEGVVVGEFDLISDASQWTLTIRPDGRFDVSGPGGVGISTSFDVFGDAQLVLYGHSVNPEAVFEEGMRLDGILVSRTKVDRFAAWRNRIVSPHSAQHVSAIQDDGHDVILLENDGGDLEFYNRTGEDWTLSNWHLEHWESARDFSFARLGGVVHLLAIDDMGNLVAAPLVDETFDTPVVILNVTTMTALGWGFMAEPSMVEFGSARILTVRTDTGIGFTSLTADVWQMITTDLTLNPSARYPSLVIHNDVYWLHVAERQGTRWRVRAFVSDQLVAWRVLGTALGASLQDDAFDRFGASHPAIIADGETMRLYYVGHDNISERVGSASRHSPNVGRQ